MSFSTGERIKISIFGQSHSEAIGVVMDGLPAGISLDFDKINAFMQRRAPGRDELSTPRYEKDIPQILSGIVNGKTCGAPLCAVIENSNTKSSDYDKIKNIPRPSHADYAAFVKYAGFNDIRGGGQFSGRMTAPLCFAGAVCMQLLEEKGIAVGGHIYSIKDAFDEPFDKVQISSGLLKSLSQKAFPVLSEESGQKMQAKILEAKQAGDSVGGIVEIAAVGLRAGVGDTFFGSLESRISSAVFAVPAIKGIEFGNGFKTSELYGSENNDAFFFDAGEVKTKTNNSGGIQGGISNGMPLVFRAAVKPTPSISKQQQSVDLSQGKDALISVGGRHDPCIVQRALVCVTAACAVVLADLII